MRDETGDRAGLRSQGSRVKPTLRKKESVYFSENRLRGLAISPGSPGKWRRRLVCAGRAETSSYIPHNGVCKKPAWRSGIPCISPILQLLYITVGSRRMVKSGRETEGDRAQPIHERTKGGTPPRLYSETANMHDIAEVRLKVAARRL